MSGTLFEHWDTSPVWNPHGNGYGNLSYGESPEVGLVRFDFYQTIIAQSNHSITSVKLGLYFQDSNGQHDIVVVIKECDVNHQPTGSALATATVSSISLPQAPPQPATVTLTEFTLDASVDVEIGKEYAIYVSYEPSYVPPGFVASSTYSAGDSTDSCPLGIFVENMVYSSANHYGNVISGFAMLFEVYGLPVLPEKPDCVTPASGTLNVQGSAGLEWVDPGKLEPNYTEGFRLFFGHTSMSLVQIGGNMTAAQVTATAKQVNNDNYYTAGSNYAWRVDAFNDNGTTTGDVWTFNVFWEDSGGDGGDRPPNTDGDTDPDAVDYNGDITTAGGGRHTSYLVAVSHKTIYIRQA